MKKLILWVFLSGLWGCASQHEADLIAKKQWHLLGEYYGEHGYQPLTDVVLTRMGATSVIDKHDFKAGYGIGRTHFCFKHDERKTWVNPDYPSECGILRRNQANKPLGRIDQGGY